MKNNKFERLIEMYNNGETFSNENVGENMILVNRDGFDLVIPKDNKDDHGYFLVNSIQGHDCYSYNSESTHIYHILDGEGYFIIDDQRFKVKAGDSITIEPNQVFYYCGKMLMSFEMTPNFKDENDHIVKAVTYDN